MWCRFFPPIAFIFFFVEIAVENIHDREEKLAGMKRKRGVSVMPWTLRTCPRKKMGNSDEDSFFTVKALPWRSEEFSGIIAETENKKSQGQ